MNRPGNIDQNYFELLSGGGDVPALASFAAERPSRLERMEIGKRLRSTVPRASHASYVPDGGRPDPVGLLVEQNATRVQKLVAVRNARMLASPFGFFRGAAAIMAMDLSRTPQTGLTVAACGDMHVSNFGLFASAERNLIFAINDFDEVHPGPWEWDLKRLAASAALAVRFMGGERSAEDEAVRGAVSAYRRQVRRYAEMGFLDVWYDRIDERTILDAVPKRLASATAAMMTKARAKGRVRTLGRLIEAVDGELRIVENPPLVVRETHTSDGTPIRVALDAMLRSYAASVPDDRKRLLSRYRIVDAARKVVGVGSVGTGCWVVFLQGLDAGDPLFLQVKEARDSVLAPHVQSRLSNVNQGRRVVAGQRLTQGSPDIFLGWGEDAGAHFYVRQLADMKGGVRFIAGDTQSLEGFAKYCELCGWALALAHAKSGDPATIAGYCGKSEVLDEAMVTFAQAYAGQTESDHEALSRAARTRQIPVANEFAPVKREQQ